MKRSNFILTIILFVGILLRLYHFTAPIADWHSWRQVDTSAVSRNFVQNGFDLLHPRFDDLSNVQSGIYFNPQGYRFVEFPIYNIFQAGGFLLFNKFTIEGWGRLVSIFSSLFAAVFLFLILKKRLNSEVGLLGAFFYSVLPFSIFWGRTVLPDETTIASILAAIYFFDDGLLKNKISHLLLSGFFVACSLLLKPFAIFFMLPLVFVAWEKYSWNFWKEKGLWIFAVLSVLPFGLWRLWMLQYPQGIPQAGWLINSGNILFSGAYLHWIYASRIPELILGFWGIFILLFGLISKYKNKFYFSSFLISSLLYLTIVARGNVQHSYYQILIVPSVCIFLGIGSYFLLKPQYFEKNLTRAILVISVVFMLAFSWFEVRDYYNIQDPAILTAGAKVDEITPKNAKVIALYNGDTTLLYYTKRKGWASFSKPIEGLIKDGASYMVIVNPTQNDYGFTKKYKLVASSKDYLIFYLLQK